VIFFQLFIFSLSKHNTNYMTNDIITMIANVALALSFIVGLVFGIAQVHAAARDRRERLTLETLREFQTREFIELMGHISFREMPVNREKFMAIPVDERTKLMQFAQEMESLGILVAEKLVSIDLVDKTLGSFVTTSWDKYKTLFYDLREKQPDPFLGEYFQWLSERIAERMLNRPRRPFFESHAAVRLK
jgi:hypothetical protein